MRRDFAPLSRIGLRPRTTFVRPPQPPELIHLDSPALTVMTDFKFVHPVTVAPSVPIDEALAKMKTAGVRLLLVANEAGEIIGLITANDILGERPIKILEETRVQRTAIMVETIMTPQAEILVLNMLSVRNAQVGHIIETLRALERQHVLVVEVDEATMKQRVIGLFSTSQISKLLGSDVSEEVPPAHSLAEMLHQIR
jgi:CBS domain-containing protein